MVPGSQPNKRKARKKHGFRVRMRTSGGRRVLAARRRKKRASLAKTTHVK